MPAATDVAIVGAGPYGLSIAAHLRMRGVEHRIIGSPMQSWLEQMPKGMCLKSEGFASNLYDPQERFTLRRFCEKHGIAYADLGTPVSLEVFCAYGLAFQRQFAPELEVRTLALLSHVPGGFLLKLDDGETFTAGRVVLATGIAHFQHLPAQLAHLPAELVSHSSAHNGLSSFKGRDVTVIGGGASAVDLAALLHESGALVRLVVRRPALDIHTKMRLPRPLLDRVRAPLSGIGPSWRSRFLTDAPMLFRHLPEATRLRVVKNHLGPAGGWFMKDRIASVPLLLGCRPERAEISHGRVHLHLAAEDGATHRLVTDHIVAATGYRVDLRRLTFLSEEIRSRLKAVEHTPVLSRHFQSSIPGLYIVGPAAANSFGPVMRFAVGAKFTARRIAKHLAATSLATARLRPRSLVLPDILTRPGQPDLSA